MDITFACSQCGVNLHAPDKAAGRRMRCPACKEVSKVPDLEALLGDSIAGMLLEQVEQELDARHNVAEAAIAKAAEEKARAQAEREKLIAFEAQRLAAQAKADLPDVQIVQSHLHSQNLMTENPKLKFPTRLLNDKARPYLIVTAVDQAGVHFAFDCRWLKHERFSMSMPRTCVHTGETQQERLVARPVVFEEQLSPHGPGAAELFGRHEVQRVHRKTDRRVLVRMGPIQDAKSPFGHPLACYVSASQSGGLRGFTRKRPGGGLTCEVVIPNPDAALQWLVRVNGACGPEYELLKSMLSGQDTDALVTSGSSGGSGTKKDPLAELDAHDRRELGKWCRMQGGERLLAFFPDAETQDAPGQAGLAVTNKRIVFKKYHRHGDAELKDPTTTLIGRRTGDLYHMALVTENTRHKMTALRERHYHKLTKFLAKHSQIQIQSPQKTPVKQSA